MQSKNDINFFFLTKQALFGNIKPEKAYIKEYIDNDKII